MSYETMTDLGGWPVNKWIHRVNMNYDGGWDDVIKFCKGPVDGDPRQYYVGGTMKIKYSFNKKDENPKGIVKKMEWDPDRGYKSGDSDPSSFYLFADGEHSVRYFMRGYICAVFTKLVTAP